MIMQIICYFPCLWGIYFFFEDITVLYNDIDLIRLFETLIFLSDTGKEEIVEI